MPGLHAEGTISLAGQKPLVVTQCVGGRGSLAFCGFFFFFLGGFGWFVFLLKWLTFLNKTWLFLVTHLPHLVVKLILSSYSQKTKQK